MLKIGITGGIGSGKSIITQVFRTLNVPVFNSDVEAKRLMTEDNGLKHKLIQLLG